MMSTFRGHGAKGKHLHIFGRSDSYGGSFFFISFFHRSVYKSQQKGSVVVFFLDSPGRVFFFNPVDLVNFNSQAPLLPRSLGS